MRTDSRLLVRLAHPADEAAWREFDSHYGPLVQRYAMRLGAPLSEAEEVRQEVMTRLVKRFRAERAFVYDRARGRFRGYLARTTESVLARHARRHARWKTWVRLAPRRECGIDPQEAWAEERRRFALQEAHSRLRSTSSLHAIEVLDLSIRGQSPERIAHTLGTTRGAVYKTRQRMLVRLRDLVDEAMDHV